MKNKITAIPASFLAGIFVIYNIILFVIAGFSGHSTSFWISYIFVLLAFALTGLFTLKIFADKKPFRYWFLGFPMLRWSVIYLICSVAFAALFMLVDSVQVTIIIQLLLIGGYCAVGAFCYFAKAQIAEIDEKIEKVYLFRLFYADLDTMSKIAADGEVKNSLTKLAEKVRYSDPNSHPSLSDAENEIQNKIFLLKGLIKSNEKEDALDLIHEIDGLVVERNARCKALKK